MSVSTTVSKTYDVPGLDPMANTVDPFDPAAVVTVTLDKVTDKQRLFKMDRADQSRYTSKEYVFRDNGLFHSYGVYWLSVTTGKGEKLSASTTVPMYRTIESSYQFVAGVTAVTTDPQWTFNWDNNQKDDHLYFPRLRLAYKIFYADSTVNETVDIPLTYVEKDGKKTPVYPSFTRKFSVTYDFSAMTTAIASISEGDTVKSRYQLGWLHFTLVEYDLNLSNFYSSMHGYLDEYSVRVDETTYSNISGGIGVFGSWFVNSIPYQMKTAYVRSFGYRN
jgi:hypothetical protein